MPEKKERSRRLFLKAAGAGLAGISGCIGNPTQTTTTKSTVPPSFETESRETTSSETENEETESVPDFDKLEHDKLIGAHYYPWYGSGHVKSPFPDYSPSDPLLGNYDSRNPDTINQHLKWALEYGINWLSISWHGPPGYYNGLFNTTIKDHILESPLMKEMNFSILYESNAILEESETGIPLDSDTNKKKFQKSLSYLDQNYFGRDNYAKIDGRPIVFLYTARRFEGDIAGTINTTVQSIKHNPYFIADVHTPQIGVSGGVFDFSAFDAVSIYSGMYFDWTLDWQLSERWGEMPSNFLEMTLQQHAKWNILAESYGLDLVPDIVPGFNKNEYPGADFPILTRNKERFREYASGVRKYLNTEPKVLLVTSFNEWYEDTQLEPGESYGTAFLEIIANQLARKSSDTQVPNYNTITFRFQHVDPETGYFGAMISEIDLLDVEGETIRKIDVGSPEEGAYFVSARFKEESDTRTWRWFGGRDKRTIVAFDPISKDSLGSLQIRGKGVEDDIRANIDFEENEIGMITFSKEWSDHSIELD